MKEPSNYISVIEPQKKLFDLKLNEIWRYRDLIALFIRREIVVKYKQTIMGPAWYVLQPVLTTIMYTVVFGNIAGLSTDGIPKILFYLAGITAWNYFAESLKLTSNIFVKEAAIFKKVYFPRIVLPITIVVSELLKFTIQFALFLTVYVYFIVTRADIAPNWTLALLPLYVFITAGLGLSFGLLVSSMTTKYRDLNFLIQFGVQLWMYATPITYPLSEISSKNQIFFMINPMTSIVEGFKYAFLGVGTFSPYGLCYSLMFMIITLLMGTVVFNRVEKNFVDTV
jgi:lipopolysaccharide transport system permease protein